MTLDDLLYMFENPEKASACAGLKRTAGYHWYASGNRRLIPTNYAIIAFIDYFQLGDEALGQVIRDAERIRERKYPRKHRRRSYKKSKKGVDWKAKEKFLEDQEGWEEDKKKSLDVTDRLARLTQIMKEHM